MVNDGTSPIKTSNCLIKKMGARLIQEEEAALGRGTTVTAYATVD